LVDNGPLKRNRNFRLLYVGQLISSLGSNLTVVAIPYQVYRDTHSNLWVGLASLIQLPFLIVGSLWGGAFGDRFDKRTLMIVSALVLALTSLALALNARLADPYLAPLLLLGAIAAGLTGGGALGRDGGGALGRDDGAADRDRTAPAVGHRRELATGGVDRSAPSIAHRRVDPPRHESLVKGPNTGRR